MAKSIQNFYKATLSLDWSIGTGTFYVSTKPTISDGWLVISPNNSTIREIIAYTSTGTDSNGDYVVVSTRGVGGTTEQIHTTGEPIRMNVTAEYWKYMGDAIDSIVAAGAPNADTTTKGLVEIATDAEVIAGTNTGGTGASLVMTPGQAKTNYEKKVSTVQVFTSSGTYTAPAGLKYAVVEMVGGGAGGVYNSSGNGGGAGGYARKILSASTIGTSKTITVGTGGGANTSGGNSSFGSLITSNGGTVPTGGTATGGDINIQGGNGGIGFTAQYTSVGGIGGNSMFGQGAIAPNPYNSQSPVNTYNGNTGTGYGSGGSAGSSSGGSGTAGIVIVTEYY